MTKSEIRALAHEAARREIARDLASLLLGDSTDDAERDWAEHYAMYFWLAFAFYSAISAGATPRAVAALVDEPDIRREIATRVSQFVHEVAA